MANEKQGRSSVAAKPDFSIVAAALRSHLSPMLIRLTLFALALASHLLSASATSPLPQPDQSPVYKQTEEADLRLHIYYPQGQPPSKPRPGIVFFFGGGWQKGRPEQFFVHCRYFADRGMVAISAEYRIRDKHGIEPEDCVRDAKSAMRWIRSHAGQLGLDPARLVAAGASAGAQLAAITAAPGGLNEPGENLSIETRPSALILYSPVLDTGPNGFVHEWVQPYWEDFSPMHNIGEQTPPTLILLGGADNITSVDTAKAYQQRMREAGVRCDLQVYPGQPHRFFVQSISQRFHEETLAEVDRFLVSLDYLPPADRSD